MVHIVRLAGCYASRSVLAPRSVAQRATVDLRNPAAIRVVHRLSPGDLLQAAAQKQGEGISAGPNSVSDSTSEKAQNSCQVKISGLGVPSGKHSFRAGGFEWSLNVIPFGREANSYFKLDIEAANQDALSKWERTGIWITPSLVLQGKEVIRSATDEALVIESQKLRRKHTFNPEASSICVGVVYASDLNAEAKAMLTTDIKVPAPTRSLSGNAELVLDSGEAFNVHSALLELSSTVLAEALASGGSRPGFRAPSLLLPGVTSAQVLILLKALYAMPATIAWADKQSPADLRELASISHALACTGLLAIADGALVKQSGKCVTAADCISSYRQARQLGMRRFQDKCAEAIITFLPSIQLSKVATSDDGLVPVPCKVQEHTVPRGDVQMEDIYRQLDAIADTDYCYSSDRRSAVVTIKNPLKAYYGSFSSAEIQEARVQDQGGARGKDEDEDDYWSDDDRWDDDDD